MVICNFSSFKLLNSPKSEFTVNNVVFDSNSNFNIVNYINDNIGLSKESYYVLSNGKKVDLSKNDFNIESGILHIIPRTYGGKGGFGSMLRAIGAQIEKTTNREACRDLSGRRLRDINEEQRLKNWIAQQADREKEAIERKKKRLERLCQEPKHEFKDDKYDESRSEMSEKMSSSIDQGLKASSSGSSSSSSRPVSLKRNSNCSSESKSKLKKRKIWIDAEESLTDESENEEIALKHT